MWSPQRDGPGVASLTTPRTVAYPRGLVGGWGGVVDGSGGEVITNSHLLPFSPGNC